MVDIHCHLLPGIDDGAGSWETAVEMCRVASADGISHVVATPHANSEFAYDRQRYLAMLEELRERTGGTPALSLGCDFNFSYENIQQLLSDSSHYTIGDTDYLLVELSTFSIPPTLRQNFQQLMATGLRPVLTHPERNPLLQHRPGLVLDWAESGVVIQVTANSVTGAWGKTAERMARWLLDREAVHVVASDAHDPRNRPPLLSHARDAIANWKSEEVALALVQDNPGAIVAGLELPYFPTPTR